LEGAAFLIGDWSLFLVGDAFLMGDAPLDEPRDLFALKFLCGACSCCWRTGAGLAGAGRAGAGRAGAGRAGGGVGRKAGAAAWNAGAAGLI